MKVAPSDMLNTFSQVTAIRFSLDNKFSLYSHYKVTEHAFYYYSRNKVVCNGAPRKDFIVNNPSKSS